MARLSTLSLRLTTFQLFADRYNVTDRTLGDGGHAIVYLAIEKATRRQLVCKIKDLDKVRRKRGAAEVRRLVQEIDILRQLDHVSHVLSGGFPSVSTHSSAV